MILRERGLAWRTCGGLCNGMAGGPGRKGKWMRAQPFIFHCRKNNKGLKWLKTQYDNTKTNTVGGRQQEGRGTDACGAGGASPRQHSDGGARRSRGAGLSAPARKIRDTQRRVTGGSASGPENAEGGWAGSIAAD